MMELIDSLIEELEKLQIMYSVKHPGAPNDPETLLCLASVKHKFSRLMRRRRFFWHKGLNKSIWIQFETMQKVEGRKRMIQHYLDAPFVPFADGFETCALRAREAQKLVIILEQINPYF